mmetsp:Transcript_45563/g.84430  ORF Transcript_45563/g.84430 Transcript_45563/m.84430 type:complete len:412 (+) Transcript_45563:894-2129(+)
MVSSDCAAELTIIFCCGNECRGRGSQCTSREWFGRGPRRGVVSVALVAAKVVAAAGAASSALAGRRGARPGGRADGRADRRRGGTARRRTFGRGTERRRTGSEGGGRRRFRSGRYARAGLTCGLSCGIGGRFRSGFRSGRPRGVRSSRSGPRLPGRLERRTLGRRTLGGRISCWRCGGTWRRQSSRFHARSYRRYRGRFRARRRSGRRSQIRNPHVFSVRDRPEDAVFSQIFFLERFYQSRRSVLRREQRQLNDVVQLLLRGQAGGALIEVEVRSASRVRSRRDGSGGAGQLKVPPFGRPSCRLTLLMLSPSSSQSLRRPSSHRPSAIAAVAGVGAPLDPLDSPAGVVVAAAVSVVGVGFGFARAPPLDPHDRSAFVLVDVAVFVVCPSVLTSVDCQSSHAVVVPVHSLDQ